MGTLVLVLACTGSQVVITGDGSADSGRTPVGDSVEVVPGDTAETVDTGDTAEMPSDDELYEAFFDVGVIQEVDIELSQASINRLNNVDGRTYVEGNVVVNGYRFDNVGVRFKGSSTYTDLDCSDGYCKAGFKIKFDEFVPGQKFGDLERVTLNNMVSDYTQSKEVIVYGLLAEHSQLASRANYARVTLNGEAWGLYANVETADDEWLKRRFEDPTGNFWGTASYYGDFYGPYLDTGWVSKSGDGDSSLLWAVTVALDSYGGDFFGELGSLVNTDQWLEYWAWCAAVGNYDGYPFTLNDVLIYADPADGNRFVFAPWGTDESWAEYELSGQTWSVVGGRLGTACLYDQACVDELLVHIGEAVDQYDQSEVLARAQAAWDLSENDALTDPKRPFTADYVWYYRDYYADLMPRYGDYVRGKAGL